MTYTIDIGLGLYGIVQGYLVARAIDTRKDILASISACTLPFLVKHSCYKDAAVTTGIGSIIGSFGYVAHKSYKKGKEETELLIDIPSELTVTPISSDYPFPHTPYTPTPAQTSTGNVIFGSGAAVITNERKMTAIELAKTINSFIPYTAISIIGSGYMLLFFVNKYLCEMNELDIKLQMHKMNSLVATDLVKIRNNNYTEHMIGMVNLYNVAMQKLKKNTY